MFVCTYNIIILKRRGTIQIFFFTTQKVLHVFILPLRKIKILPLGIVFKWFQLFYLSLIKIKFMKRIIII